VKVRACQIGYHRIVFFHGSLTFLGIFLKSQSWGWSIRKLG
jgi:hypothetical protein